MDIVISSRERDSGTPENFVKNIEWAQHVGSAPPAQGYEIMLSSAAIPYTFYGIDATNNVVVWEDESGLQNVVTIPTGTFKPADLAAYLGTAMSLLDLGGDYTCTFDSNLGKFTFTKTLGGGSWMFILVDALGNKFTAFEALGIEPSDVSAMALTGEGVPVEMPCVINIMHIKRVYIHVGWPGVRTYDSRVNQWNNVIGVATIGGDWGETINYEPNNPTRFKSHTLPEAIPIFLTNHEGEFINLNCQEWQLTLTVYGLEGTTLSSEEVRVAEPNRARNAAAKQVTAPPQSGRGMYNAPAARMEQGGAASGLNDYSHGILNRNR